MNKEIAKKLQKRAEQVAQKYSNSNREYNYSGEQFSICYIQPLSDATAVVVYEKTSHKKAAAFFYWIRGGGGYWHYFFPTDSHILGMEALSEIKRNIENENFMWNFDKEGLSTTRLQEGELVEAPC